MTALKIMRAVGQPFFLPVKNKNKLIPKKKRFTTMAPIPKIARVLSTGWSLTEFISCDTGFFLTISKMISNKKHRLQIDTIFEKNRIKIV